MSAPIELVNVELTKDHIAAKLVFRARNAQGRWATFETGSFLAPTAAGLPEKHDICVSTAGGCTRHCTFCAASSPDPGFERLLTTEEIVAQFDE
jgi:adenine C2-methylase RlmN of 23S rRNA A2503 and tRNA A37